MIAYQWFGLTFLYHSVSVILKVNNWISFPGWACASYHAVSNKVNWSFKKDGRCRKKFGEGNVVQCCTMNSLTSYSFTVPQTTIWAFPVSLLFSLSVEPRKGVAWTRRCKKPRAKEKKPRMMQKIPSKIGTVERGRGGRGGSGNKSGRNCITHKNRPSFFPVMRPLMVWFFS